MSLAVTFWYAQAGTTVFGGIFGWNLRIGITDQDAQRVVGTYTLAKVLLQKAFHDVHEMVVMFWQMLQAPIMEYMTELH